MRLSQNSWGRWLISAHHIATGVESEVSLDVVERPDGKWELWHFPDDDAELELHAVFDSEAELMAEAREILPPQWRP